MRNQVVAAVIMIGLAIVARADDPPVATVDLARARSLAIDACVKKYPETDRDALKYSGLTLTATTNDQIVVSVTYLLSGTDASEDVEKNGFQMTKTKQTTYVVKMETSGNITDVSSGSSVKIQSSGRRSPANKTGGR